MRRPRIWRVSRGERSERCWFGQDGASRRRSRTATATSTGHQTAARSAGRNKAIAAADLAAAGAAIAQLTGEQCGRTIRHRAGEGHAASAPQADERCVYFACGSDSRPATGQAGVHSAASHTTAGTGRAESTWQAHLAPQLAARPCTAVTSAERAFCHAGMDRQRNGVASETVAIAPDDAGLCRTC